MNEIKEVNLLRIETKFDMTKGDIDVRYSVTELFEGMMDETNSRKDVVEALVKIENIIDELISGINDKMKEEMVENV